MYDRILVPVDGSTSAEQALPWAVMIARESGATLKLVTVIEPISTYVYDGWEDAALEWSASYLSELSGRWGRRLNVPVETEVRHGHAVEELQAVATEWNADLTVLASHGRGPLSRLWLGSVADGFVRTTDRPALVVPVVDGEVSSAEPPQDIAVPLDGSELSESALQHAVELGALFDAGFHLTRVVALPTELASPYLPHTTAANQEVLDNARDQAADYLERHADRLRDHGYRVTTAVVVDGQPGPGIVREAEAVDADLIAMATHGHRGLKRALLGSCADKVLRAATVPVILYRPADPPR